MAAIKKFFQKKKLDVKFKKAGEGHAMDKPISKLPPSYHQASASTGVPRGPSSGETRRAGEAALARMETKEDQTFQLARVRMKKQMAKDKKALEDSEAGGNQYRAEPSELVQDAAPVLSMVLFKCPEIGPLVLSKPEMEAHIHEYLLISLAEEPEMSSALMIHTLNKSTEKVKVAIDTLVKYIDNIIEHPGEEKYRRIRVNNKAFQERVACLEGTHEFLQAARFNVTVLPQDDSEENFYMMSEEDSRDGERMQGLKDVLLAAEPIRPQLDRNIKVFFPSNTPAKFSIPDEFYNISPEELKKEHERQVEAVETMGLLRTKAMREREEQRELRKYRYALIRVRFPDGIMLQGTFKTVERVRAIFAFIRESLLEDWMPFLLSSATGHKLTEDDPTLAESSLAPASVINFAWDPNIQADIARQKGKIQQGNYLQPELMALMQNI